MYKLRAPIDSSLNNTLRVKHHFHAGMAICKALGLIFLQIIGGRTHGAGDNLPGGFIAVGEKWRHFLSTFIPAIKYRIEIFARSCFQDDTLCFGSSGCDLLAKLTFKHCPFGHWVIVHGGLFRGSVFALDNLAYEVF